MAKKPKKADPPQSDEPDLDGGKAKGSGRKKLVLLGALALLVLCGAGAGGYAYWGRSKSDGAEAARVGKPVAFMEVREMVINLASGPNQERQRLLKFRAALEVRDAKIVGEIQPLLPRVEDAFQAFARELRASDLDGSAGLYRLREELLRRVNIAVYPAKVDAVLFKDMVVE